MQYRILTLIAALSCLLLISLHTQAQDLPAAEEEKPVILYSGTPKKYEIADIKVEGAQNYEDYVLIGLSGLVKK